RANALSKFQNRDLLRIPDIYWFVLVRIHQPINPLDQVRNITEAAGMLSVTINGDGLAPKGLVYKIRQRTAIVEAHTRTVSIKDSDDMGVHTMEAVIGHHHSFRESLGFVVHSA